MPGACRQPGGQNDGRRGERGGPGAAIAYRGIVDETPDSTVTCLVTCARVIYIAEIARTSWLPRDSTSGACRQQAQGRVPSGGGERAAPPRDYKCRPSTHGSVPDTGEGASDRVERAMMDPTTARITPRFSIVVSTKQRPENGLRARAQQFLLHEPRLVSYLCACPIAVRSISQPRARARAAVVHSHACLRRAA